MDSGQKGLVSDFRDMASALTRVHPPMLAGKFYPAKKEFLAKVIDRHLANSAPKSEGFPKAVIAPHSGLIYSGSVAASAYANWKHRSPQVNRVVIVGPSHLYDFPGIALPDATMLETPLGEVMIDEASCEKILGHNFVRVFQAPYQNEQSIEVELPFLQRLFAEFEIVPLLTGRCDAGQIARVLEDLWGGDETVLMVSSNLSREYRYESAGKIDYTTAEHIRTLEGIKLAAEQACGYRAIRGLLKVAARRGLRCEVVDLRNSGDTADESEEIIGFGAFHFYE